MDFTFLIKEGQIAIKNKQYQVAEDILKSAFSLLETKEKSNEKCQMLSEAYNNLGFIYYKKVEFYKAVECYDESIKLDSSYGIAYYNRGTIQYRLGFYESAVRDMEKAVLNEPGNSEFKIGLDECKNAMKLISD